jgi:hypothetical protein
VFFARVGQSLSTFARHIFPVAGIFTENWHPATAMGVYWVESILLGLAASILCAIMIRRTSPTAIERARSAGDHEEAAALRSERIALNQARINAGDVFGFHVIGMLGFGFAIGGVTLMLVKNGHVEPIRWVELRDGAMVMMLIVSIGFLFDLWRFDRYGAADLKQRVDACLARWKLFWVLGFFGALIIWISGRPVWFLGFFSVLKVTYESWTRLTQLFAKRPSNVRQAAQAMARNARVT